MANNNAITSNYQTALKQATAGNFDLAISKLKVCTDLDEEYSDALILLARLYLQTSQLDCAFNTYQRARNIEKFITEAVAGTAKILRLQGNVLEAYDFIKEQIKSLKPHISIILAYSEICLELERYAEAIQKIRAYLNDQHKDNQSIQSVEDEKNLLHTLGKLYDKEKDYEMAFRAHQSANELTKSLYNPQQFERRLTKIQATYSSDFLKSCNYSSIKSNKPVFIVGMPRSGTTLIEQILSCHTDIYAAGELSTIQQLVARMCRGGYPEQMRHVERAALNECAQIYVDRECSKQHRFTTDKMPHNYLYLGVIQQLFPDSKIINVNRDPVDNCLSIYFQFFNDSHRYATSLSNIAHHYTGHNKLMDYWKQQFPENIIDIQYEELVNNTQHEVTRILDLLGLEWQDSCLQHYSSKRHVLTASQQQVNKPIYKQSIKRWKNYQAFISPLLSDLKRYKQIQKRINQQLK